MARKRMIDPSFWRDEKVGGLAYIERLIFIGLWNCADDNGVGRANPNLLKSDIFPYDTTATPASFEKHLMAIAEKGLIRLYKVDNQNYFFVTHFDRYQVINKPTPSKLPLPDAENAEEYGGGVSPPKATKEKPAAETKGTYSEFGNVKLTDSEYGKLVDRFGETETKKAIEELGGYMKSKGKRYTDHYATLINWVKRNQAASGKKQAVNYDEE